jgi:hypothetical protein
MTGDWKPTGQLRWLRRRISDDNSVMIIEPYLQAWYAPDVPAYMIGNEGEWRDVPYVESPDA